jgi:hypothetical protein
MARAVHAAPVATPAVGALIAADTPLVSIAVLAGAIGFHLAGCMLLLLGAPPFAALHAFAAFIVLSVVAASHQLLPVLLRVPPTPWTQTAIPAAGFTLGFALLIAAFLGAPLFAVAGGVLAATAAVWCMFAGSRMLRAVSERQSAAAMGAAVAAFAVAAWLGVTMAFDVAGLRGPAQQTATAHGTLMIAAFASMLIVAISYRFVPMFSLSHASAYGSRALQWVFLAGALLAAVQPQRWAYAVLLFAIAALGYQHVATLRKRLRKRLDPSLIYGSAAWILAAAAAATASIGGMNARTAPALVTLSVLGWLSVTIFGYGLKICGFLSWQLAKQRAPEAMLAPLATAIPLREAYAALGLLVAGSIGVIFSAWAAGAYLAGALLYASTFARVAYPYFATYRRASA